MRPRPEQPDALSPASDILQHQQDLRAWFEEVLANPNVQAAMKIPADEPTFILRAQDIFAGDALNSWLALAANAGVPAEKFRRAADEYQRILEWQNVQPTRAKIPD